MGPTDITTAALVSRDVINCHFTASMPSLLLGDEVVDLDDPDFQRSWLLRNLGDI